MRIQHTNVDNAESLEMTAASTAFYDEIDPCTGSGNHQKASAIACLVSKLKEVKEVLAREQPMVIFENTRDGSVKTDRNGIPIARLSATGKRLLSWQAAPYYNQLLQIAPYVAFPPFLQAIYKLIDDDFFRKFNENNLGLYLPNGQLVGQYLNERLTEARRAARRKSAKAEQEKWSEGLAKQAKRVEAYFYALLDSACPVQVSRLEVSSHEGIARPDFLVEQFANVLHQAQKDGLLWYLIGHAWRLCRSADGRVRLHVMLFSDTTNMVYADDPARNFGSLWQEKIAGGVFFNRLESPYKQFGDAVFYPSDAHMRDFLVEGLTRFLVKNDAYFRPRLPEGRSDQTLFGIGELLKKPQPRCEPGFADNWRGSGWRRHAPFTEQGGIKNPCP